ncbi:hypothetical protein MWR45_12440 [Escherichia coli]|nr:hypothetical protein [Escherichia coli]
MSNQRFYIVRICVPESLIFISPYLKKELLVQSECPKGYFPIFLVIDRANIEKSIACFTFEYAKKEIKRLHKKYPELESYPNPKISPLLHIKKDSTNKTLRISPVLNNGETKDYNNTETKFLLDLCLYDVCNLLIREQSLYTYEDTEVRYINNTIDILNKQIKIESISKEKSILKDYLSSENEFKNSNKKKFVSKK